MSRVFHLAGGSGVELAKKVELPPSEVLKLARNLETNLVRRVRSRTAGSYHLNRSGGFDREYLDTEGHDIHEFLVATVGINGPQEDILSERIIAEMEKQGPHVVNGVNIMAIDCSKALDVNWIAGFSAIEKDVSETTLRKILSELAKYKIDPRTYGNLQDCLQWADVGSAIFKLIKELAIGEKSKAKFFNRLQPLHLIPIFRFGGRILPVSTTSTYQNFCAQSLSEEAAKEVARLHVLTSIIHSFQGIDSGTMDCRDECGPFGTTIIAPEVALRSLRDYGKFGEHPKVDQYLRELGFKNPRVAADRNSKALMASGNSFVIEDMVSDDGRVSETPYRENLRKPGENPGK